MDIWRWVGRWVMNISLVIAIGLMTIAGFPLNAIADVTAADIPTAEVTTAATTATTTAAMTEAAQPDGAKIFASSCAACHIGGTNVLVAQKTLEQEALEKFAMDSIEAIQTQVTHGKNAMPAFSKKLSEPEIAAVADYVLRQAQAGW